MKLKLYHVDAFADKVFKGNPAAVIPLKKWLSDKTLQSIALENNLSETAFFVKDRDAFLLRWFTPAREVELCGHATMATAHVIFNSLGYKKREIVFASKSGRLYVKKSKRGISMNFPAIESLKADLTGKLDWLASLRPVEIFTSKQDLMVVVSSQAIVESYKPNLAEMNFAGHRGLIITAKGKNVDFVSRCFYPEIGVQEDPVTGSAHCQLAPYWSKKLRKQNLKAKQLSERGGKIECMVYDERIIISGKAVMYLTGTIEI